MMRVAGCWHGYLSGARCRLTVSCFGKIQIGFIFLVPAHPVVPDKGPLNGCVCIRDYKQRNTLTLAAWNVRTLLDRGDRHERRSAIIARELGRCVVDIAALSEIRLRRSRRRIHILL